MFFVLFSSLMGVVFSLATLVFSIWDHELVVIKLSLASLIGWGFAFVLAIVLTFRNEK